MGNKIEEMSDEEVRKELKRMKELKSAKERHQESKDELEDMKAAAELGAKNLDIAQKTRDVERERLKAEQERQELRFKNGEILEEELRIEKAKLLIAQQNLDTEEKAQTSAEAAIKRWTGITKESGNMFRLSGANIAGWSNAIKSTLNPLNIAGDLVLKMKESTIALFKAQDKSIVAFRKATGAIGNYGQVIVDVERSMYNAGVTTDEAGAAMTSLFNNMTDFTMMGQSTKTMLVQNVALMSELGINSETTSKNMQFMTKVMGSSNKEAINMTRELHTFAQDLGVSSDKMASDFEKMGPMIAALGDKGVDAFRQLEVQAKKTGLAVDTLVQVADGFDTFKSAADHVGKLNAILGGPYLNTLEMVSEVDPSKRMEILSENVRAAGLSWDSMSYYQKKALTQQLGLNNEMELAMFLSGDLEKAQGPAKSAAQMKELLAQTQKFNTVADEFKQFMMSLAISMSPLIDIIKQTLDGLTKMAPLLKALGILAGIIASYFAVMAVASAIASGGLTVLAGAAALGILGTAYGMGSTDSGATVGGFAKGGVSPGGSFLVGERGPEIVTLPQGAQVAAHGSAAFRGMLANGNQTSAPSPVNVQTGATNVKVFLGDKQIKQLMQEVTVDKYVDGKPSPLYNSIMGGFSREIMEQDS